MDESVPGAPKVLEGRFVNLFDAELRTCAHVTLTPGSRFFLLDLETVHGNRPRVLASACKALPGKNERHRFSLTVEGVPNTPAIVLLHMPNRPSRVSLSDADLTGFKYENHMLWIRFNNEAQPRELRVSFD
jgi:hypothetical protein